MLSNQIHGAADPVASPDGTARRQGPHNALKDIDVEWWTIPAESAKNNLSYRVPLSPQAWSRVIRYHSGCITKGGRGGFTGSVSWSGRCLPRPAATIKGHPPL